MSPTGAGAFRTRGHPAVLGFIRRAVISERPPHALLLAGPEGVGKTTLSLDVAAGLLCLDPDSASRPCRQCAACRKVEHGNHPDVHRLAPEGAGQQIRVGQVLALASELALLPLEGRFRLAIIEHAQRLNQDAQNALLKTLEEPPPAVVLILAADDSSSLLPTVISRCVRMRLGPVAPDVVAGMLGEAGQADAARGSALAQLAGGRPGVAFALAAQPDAVLAQARLARSLLDLLSADRRRRLGAQAQLLEDGAALAAAASGVAGDGTQERDAKPRATERGAARRPSPAERRVAVGQVLAVWRAVARDLAFASRGARRELRLRDLLDELLIAGQAVDPQDVSQFLSRLDGVSRAVDAYANPELAVDAMLLAWPRSRRAA